MLMALHIFGKRLKIRKEKHHNSILFYNIVRRGMTVYKSGEKDKDKHVMTTNVGSKQDIENLLKRYKDLGTKDKVKLIKNHLKNVNDIDVNKIYEFAREKEIEKGNKKNEYDDEDQRRKRIKILRIQKIKLKQKPSFLQQKSNKKNANNNLTFKNDYNSSEDVDCLEMEKQLKSAQKYTLIEDIYKSYIYSKAFTTLSNQYRTKHTISNDFLHVMICAIRNSILEKVNPTLVNEFGVFKNPYMLMKNSLFNYILHEQVKNPYEESLIYEHLNKKTYLNILKLESADTPVQVYEPLVSFHGDVNYNYDMREKFSDIMQTMIRLLRLITISSETSSFSKDSEQSISDTTNKAYHSDGSYYDKQGTTSTSSPNSSEEMNLLNNVLKILPENISTHFENYPFENLKSFKTNIKKQYIGGIKNSKPLNVQDEELNHMRYPNLQSVSHSLPKDAKYRDNVIHAIKVLERSKYWDHSSKIKAINTLIDVWNNMHSSDHYEHLLDKSLPVIYTKDMLQKTKTRQDTYNRGLTYIQSLTTQKPLGARLKIKKG
ncbi:hypothetical protein, conserved [Plasmodium gonderi]|uniref:Uncharacterized protein n=1 Tax=Plasmodium gonderi TaxID=77519 RepID=A0A1Y1JBQ4_PLAGO|nr:hypothetical protein, conserved [Plasmodium gonderi]GAW79949.1 hypothetical protein, conserved [Plasmodium gonderi]